MRVPNARASIIWIVGEYADSIPLLTPDILRRLATSFKTEDQVVKQQVLNLSTNLLMRNPEDATLSQIFQYVCNMTKFDLHYDLRDRARTFRAMLMSSSAPILRQRALQLLVAEKPAPEVAVDEENFMLNSLSHVVNHTAIGYLPLRDWPVGAVPDPRLRDQAARKQPPQSLPLSQV